MYGMAAHQQITDCIFYLHFTQIIKGFVLRRDTLRSLRSNRQMSNFASRTIQLLNIVIKNNVVVYHRWAWNLYSRANDYYCYQEGLFINRFVSYTIPLLYYISLFRKCRTSWSNLSFGIRWIFTLPGLVPS